MKEGALEFLLTYGWAVLIVVVVVSALIVMNILNPEAFNPENNNGVKCYETVILNDVSEHCNTTCKCEITCLNIDNESIKRN